MLPAATLLCRGYPRRFPLLGLASSLRPLAPAPWASHPAAELVARVLGACGLQPSLAPDDGRHFAIGLSGVFFRTAAAAAPLMRLLTLPAEEARLELAAAEARGAALNPTLTLTLPLPLPYPYPGRQCWWR